MNRVAIVVLNWNGIEDTLECLDSLNAQDYTKFDIVVVDNGSVDDSVQQLKHYATSSKRTIHLIQNPVNKGFAGGVNTGIRYALDEYDAIALFNNDAIAETKWLSSLVHELDRTSVGIVTGLLLHRDGETIDSSGDWLSHWGLPFPRNRGDKTELATEGDFVFGASGGASLYRSKLFKDIGLFDETFFAYYEDADVSYRAQLAGWKVFYTPDAIAYHKQGATSKKIPGFAVYQTFKNLPLLFIKNTPTKLLWTVGIRFYLSYWLIVGNALVKGNIGPVVKGVFASFVLGFGALGKRIHIQHTKRVSAAYIKSIFWNDLPPDQTGMRKLRKVFTGKN